MSRHKKKFVNNIKKADIKGKEVKKEVIYPPLQNIKKEDIPKPKEEVLQQTTTSSITDESNLIMTTDFEKSAKLSKIYKLKEVRTGENNGTKTYVFYKN